jgi:hypothetical protein
MLNQEDWLKKSWRRLDDEIRQSQAFISRSEPLTLLNRYERTISREYERAMKAFNQARAEQKIEKIQNEPKPEPNCGAGSQPAAASQAEIEKIQNEPKTPVVITEQHPQTEPQITPGAEDPPLPRAA